MNIPGRKYFDGESVFSDWFPRGGDNMILRAEAIDRSPETPGLDLKIEVWTKNADQNTDGASAGTGWDLTVGSGVGELIKESTSSTGLKELVRYKLSTTGTGDWILARIFPPIFFDSARG